MIYTFTELKELIKFVRAQGATDIKRYIIERAFDLEISIEESFYELMESAMDYYIDVNFK